MLINLKDILSIGNYSFNRLFSNSACNKEVVLLYHSVGNLSRYNDPLRLNLQSPLFHRQIEFLSRLDRKRVTLTFDDGFVNFFDVVFPLVLKYNMPTTLFVTTGFIDGIMNFRNFFRSQVNLSPLNWNQIKEIASCGIQIGSHGITHRDLSQLDDQTLYREINGSKLRIEDQIQKKVMVFSYPFGARKTFDNRAKEILKICGYQKAYTNIMGFNSPQSDLFELRRIRIYSDDNLLRFRLKLNGGYNWIDNFPLQKSVKK